MGDPEGKPKILIVDNEINARRVLQVILEREGYEILQAVDYESALQNMRSGDPDTIITDLRMPGKSGLEVFEFAKNNYPDVPVIFLTAFGSVESAVEAMTRGAFYYFIKPPDYAILKGIVARSVEQRRLRRELESLRLQLSDNQAIPSLVGKNHLVRKIQEIIDAVKDSDSSVLLTGETGTGKEVIARRIHYTGDRRDRSFVAVNCAAIPATLLESELFGYEKGAFTGASSRRIGKIEEAAGGTLFLDEIGEMELALCAKLLRALQEKEIERLGSNRKIKVDFRLISSTNRDLLSEVRAGLFREDIYYRINVVEIRVPPLRERKDDIPLLASAFLKESCAKEGKVLDITPDAMKVLCSYPWPGNVRQLKNSIERTVVLAPRRNIGVESLPEDILSFAGLPQELPVSGKTLKNLEETAVREALQKARGNKARASRLLGISRKCLYKKIRDYAIQ